MPRMTGFCLGMLCLCMIQCLSTSVIGAEPRWGRQNADYVVVDQDLRAVLGEVSHHMGIPAHVSEEIKGRVHERMQFNTDRELVAALASRFGFVWYFDGSALYFSALKENQSQILPLGQVTIAYLQQELGQLGILDSRFEFRYSETGRILYVSGPPRYVELVRQGLEAANAQTVAAIQNRAVNVIYGATGR